MPFVTSYVSLLFVFDICEEAGQPRVQCVYTCQRHNILLRYCFCQLHLKLLEAGSWTISTRKFQSLILMVTQHKFGMLAC